MPALLCYRPSKVASPSFSMTVSSAYLCGTSNPCVASDEISFLLVVFSFWFLLFFLDQKSFAPPTDILVGILTYPSVPRSIVQFSSARLLYRYFVRAVGPLCPFHLFKSRAKTPLSPYAGTLLPLSRWYPGRSV